VAKHYTYFVSLVVPLQTHNEVDTTDHDVLVAFQVEALKVMRDPEKSTWIKVTLEDMQEYACPEDDEYTTDKDAGPTTPVDEPVRVRTAVERQVADLLAGLGEEV
jgi:hypothetical protein